MRSLFVLSVLAAVGCFPVLPAAGTRPPAGTDHSLLDLPGLRDYKVDAYLDAAVKLQAMGKDKATAILADLSKKMDPTASGEPVIILCRMLFRPSMGASFRRPGLGGPFFVGQGSPDWPLEPIELVDGVPFLVVNGYLLGGYPEPAGSYLDYCLRYCDWNDEAFRPKTTEEKQAALAKLMVSPRWKKPLSEEAKKVLSAQIEP